jgi:hypothetical protein
LQFEVLHCCFNGFFCKNFIRRLIRVQLALVFFFCLLVFHVGKSFFSLYFFTTRIMLVHVHFDWCNPWSPCVASVFFFLLSLFIFLALVAFVNS